MDDDAFHVHDGASRGSRCFCRPVQRRSHTKSRKGCGNSLPSSSATVPRKRGRPMKAWTLSLSTVPAAQADTSPTEPCPALPQLNVEDLQLYHHYMTRASLAQGDDVLWHDKVPLLSFEHHYVLHLMLALSALHQAWQRPVDANKLMGCAEAHHAKGLREVTELLPRIDKTNCSALYVATVLIFSYTLARSPTSKAHPRVDTERAEITWLTLFRGIRFTIESMGMPAIFSGYLGPFPRENTTPVPPARVAQGYIPWEEPLADLARLLPVMPDAGLEILYEGLVDCFQEVYGTRLQPESITNGKTHIVLRWLWIIEDDFIHQVGQGHPGALILLAHFAVLLQTVDCFWYTTGWASRVLDDVVQNLPDNYTRWISWPREHLMM
ncbi:unnamed protein product [Clonostachys chloroleuca]|uniref:Sterol uptake control protein 2 n=1 Tax=Clonostachys chloroleuca TaxID=1926264 RepID=A0AA35M901_9HYPO|nr:unnamed protein product [Clonostachys chloroleuca]